MDCPLLNSMEVVANEIRAWEDKVEALLKSKAFRWEAFILVVSPNGDTRRAQLAMDLGEVRSWSHMELDIENPRCIMELSVPRQRTLKYRDEDSWQLCVRCSAADGTRTLPVLSQYLPSKRLLDSWPNKISSCQPGGDNAIVKLSMGADKNLMLEFQQSVDKVWKLKSIRHHFSVVQMLQLSSLAC